MEKLILAGAEVDVVDERSGYTPLHVAIHLGKLWAVEVLLAAGADRNLMTCPPKPLDGGDRPRFKPFSAVQIAWTHRKRNGEVHEMLGGSMVDSQGVSDAVDSCAAAEQDGTSPDSTKKLGYTVRRATVQELAVEFLIHNGALVFVHRHVKLM